MVKMRLCLRSLFRDRLGGLVSRDGAVEGWVGIRWIDR